ncbi:MAG: M48 family metallopeptidase [Opitutaceae bacterium]|nr:M48 family metallopeptidase [Opitutaceae bacterium]
MDFFEAQARAKRRTTRLVMLFAVAVLGTISAAYLIAVLLTQQVPAYADGTFNPDGLVWWNPPVFGVVALGTLAIVGIASLGKWLSFRAGGSTVAESVGARRIDPGRATPEERRLLNVVEEMSIASGVPMPAVYVLDEEPGINAFAAGLTTSDAVVAVTRGTLEKLNRDELQGVVAHEFSHILNGDMRLNVKLTAIVFGILVLGLMGRAVIWSLRGVRVRSGNSKNSGGIVVGIFVLGLALLIVGYIGYFFGRLIQAAVSRQREFLADASAIQFTRNPGGIGGALKKIGGYALGSRLQSHKTTALGHFFFAQGFKSSFGGLWATHPPLAERIRAIEPTWDGRTHEPPTTVDVARESFQTAGFAPGAVPPRLATERIAFQPATIIGDVGQLTDTYFLQAQTLLATMPDPLRAAARHPAQAPALVCGLLCAADPVLRARQLDLVRQHAGSEVAVTLEKLLPALTGLDPAARLPLLLISIPALRQLKPTDLEALLGALDELVHADNRVSTFEFVLQKLLVHHLKLAQRPDQRTDYVSFHAVADEIAVVLSVLAREGGRDPQAIGTAFATGAAQLKLIEQSLQLQPAETCGFAALDPALERLASASLPIKKRLLVAAAHVIGADGTINVAEAELYRAIAATIDCPLPPIAAPRAT